MAAKSEIGAVAKLWQSIGTRDFLLVAVVFFFMFQMERRENKFLAALDSLISGQNRIVVLLRYRCDQPRRDEPNAYEIPLSLNTKGNSGGIEMCALVESST